MSPPTERRTWSSSNGLFIVIEPDPRRGAGGVTMELGFLKTGPVDGHPIDILQSIVNVCEEAAEYVKQTQEPAP